MTYFLDTNVLVRFLVGDHLQQQKQAKVWFREAENGKRRIIVQPVVIAEVCFVLESYYKFSRDKIAEVLEIFTGQRWIEIINRDVLHNLWPHYRNSLHFVDSFLLAAAQIEHGQVLSFDKKLLKKQNINQNLWKQ